MLDQLILTCDAPSRNRYSHGCRCEACRAWQRETQRAYYQRKGGNHNRNPEAERAARTRLGSARTRWPESAKRGDALRRARKAGVDSEPVDITAIFERDGWLCGICSQPVDRALSYPHPLSASLDHITPLSLGGPHKAANVRCSHLACNVKRGNRTA